MIAKYKICVISGSRAEYDLLSPVIMKLKADPEIECSFVITGSHLENEFGNTQTAIEKDGINVDERIRLPLSGDGKADMARATGVAISSFADYFEDHHFDYVVVLGDRFEIFGAAAAAAMVGYPIAHMYGGDTTEGAVDEFFRHSITKMSQIHFTSAEEYRKRVIQLGEDPKRVFNVGSMGVENSLHLPLVSLDELSESIDFKLESEKYAVVTFHPVTQEDMTMQEQMDELIAAMDDHSELRYVITKSNADAGGRLINEIWESESSKRENWILVPSLGAVRYLSAVKHSAFVLGNSSSGISEVPSMKVPTVNIGDRQKGRVMADSLICCEPTCMAINSAIKKALSPEFREIAANTISPFGDGNTSSKIVAEIKNSLSQGTINLKKKFYDIDYKLG